MSRLPVIVGYGGVNPAGRVSCNHAYRRLVIDALPQAAADTTYASLAGLMNVNEDMSLPANRQWVNEHTLIRRIEHFDPQAVPWQRKTQLAPNQGSQSFRIPARGFPSTPPKNWQWRQLETGDYEITLSDPMEVLLPDLKTCRVSSAGQLPTGFKPHTLYQSRNHPRGLQLAIFGASDAVASLGIDWSVLKQVVSPDQIAVYSGSAMGQLDQNGNAGLLQAPWKGKRPSSKQLTLAIPEMPGDFVNAYILGNVGSTGAVIGACATFLYNLRAGYQDITSGRRRVVVVGNAESNITPEVLEGFVTMGALAEDDALCALDGGVAEPDYRRACRPFGENCGFTLSEGAFYSILMDDELALELGLNIHGSVAGVFVNADGYKKSIPGPGVGNYLTVAKAAGLARAVLGEQALRQHSYMHAHGTGTPQNRTTESRIFNEVARAFGIENWPVAAVKAYLGHSLAPASGDQLAAVLGAWQDGWIPGITTIDELADDVHHSNLNFSRVHVEMDPQLMAAAFINAKGFGGNNATGLILSPHQTHEMLRKKHGGNAMKAHAERNESVCEAIADYDQQMTAGNIPPIYQFGQGVLEGEDLSITEDSISIPGFEQAVSLALNNPFPDMTSP